MKFIIRKKQSNTGTIHDIKSDIVDRIISVPKGSTHIIVLSSYYEGKGYYTTRSEESALKLCNKLRRKNYSFKVFLSNSLELYYNGDRFQCLVNSSELEEYK